MAVLTLKKEIKHPVQHTLLIGTSMVAAEDRYVGGNFTVQQEARLKGIGWGRTFPAPTLRQVGIWSDTSLLGQTVINSTGTISAFVSPITLKPNVTYTIGFEVKIGDTLTNWRSITTAPYPLTLTTDGLRIDSSILAKPTLSGTGWLGDHIFDFEYSTYDEKIEPPEPLVGNAGREFMITLPKEWMPYDLLEWDLQYQSSTDNSNFGRWIDIGTFPSQVLPDETGETGDTDLDPETTGTYTHSSLDINQPLPYYRYRYRLRTKKEESNWSEAVFAGQVKNIADDLSEPLDASKVIDPGSITGDLVGPDTISGSSIQTGTLTALQIASGTITADNIAAGTITGDKIAANTINAANIQAGTITATQMGANSITATQIQAGAITAGKLSAGAIDASNLIVSGTINGNHIQPGVINGVHIQDGGITASDIAASTITAKQLAAGFIDANVSQTTYLDASAIKGGELRLGGPVNYQQYRASSGDLVWPWKFNGTTIGNLLYPGGPTPGTRKYTATLGNTIRVDFESGQTLSTGQTLMVMYDRTVTGNNVSKFQFNISIALPTNLRLELIDGTGAARPAAPWFKAGSYTTSTTLENSGIETDTTKPAAIGFQLRATGAVTFGASQFIEIRETRFEFEKGYGLMNVYDAVGNLRSEVTAEYIGFNKVVGAPITPRNITANRTFLADSQGVWVPNDSFTVGSALINDLEYSPRDLSGQLVINPRFENLRTADPTKIIPSDWTCLPSETQFGYKDGVYPQYQSLVSGRVLTMTVPAGWTNASGTLVAVSHKRYVVPEATLPSIPFSMSAHFRTPFNDPDIGVRIRLYVTTSASDVSSITEVQSGTLLGEGTSTGLAINSTTVDNNIEFKPIGRSYYEATGAAGDLMKTGAATYVYLTLEAYVKVGRPALSTDRIVEWDNVDLVIAEQKTPSDNQSMADVSRRVTDTATLLQYMLSNTKAILPELSGNQGLVMTVVT